MIKSLVEKNRSYRKFDNSKKVETAKIVDLIDLARISPSSKNRQPLLYHIVNNVNETDEVFSCLKFALHLANWNGPTKNEQPAAYIVMIVDKDKNLNADIDAGIASQTILLAATEQELGGCIVRSVDRKKLRGIFNYPDNHEIVLVLAIGYPIQKVVLTELNNDESTTYYEDDNGVHYVPKRKLKDIIVNYNKK